MSGRSPAAPRAQRGFALIAILALAALLSAFLIASALNRSSADIANEREDRSMSALRQAKTALIAYAANEQWQNTGGVTPFQPGALPCPDRDNDGIAEDHEVPQKPCDTGLKRIGRFPWKTIGSDDLRDASGERIWYAVSASFLKNTPSYTNIINSDTLGQLTVTGTAAASNAVAILFAPGERVGNQTRDPANAVTYNDPANFLEQFNTATYATFSSNSLPNTSPLSPSNALNDRVLVITQADLMAVVEPVVAAIIERDIRPNIQGYFSDWNSYPFPTTFDPTRVSQSQFIGSTGTLTAGLLAKGLLPVSTSALTWRFSSISVTQIPGGTGSGVPGPSGGGGCPGSASGCTLDSVSCGTAGGGTRIVCTVRYSGSNNDRPAIRLQASLQNAALSFPKLLAVQDASMVDENGDPLSSAPGYGNWSQVGGDVPLVHPPSAISTINTSPVDGNALVVFSGRLQNPDNPPAGTGGRVTITVNVPAYQPFTDPTNTSVGWFAANEWFRQTYFAVSAGFLPGAGNSCNQLPSPPASPPLCLQVNNLRPSYANAKDKQVIVVLAGRSLGNSPRPSTTLTDYFENANLTAINSNTMIFENRAGNPTTINDRVVVISP